MRVEINNGPLLWKLWPKNSDHGTQNFCYSMNSFEHNLKKLLKKQIKERKRKKKR